MEWLMNSAFRAVHDQERSPFKGVYVIGLDAEGPVKVGVSTSPIRRMASQQSGNWVRLHLMSFSYFFRPAPGLLGAAKMMQNLGVCALEVERYVQAVFNECDVSLCGEWAAVTAEDAQAVIRKAAKDLRLGECHCGPKRPISSKAADRGADKAFDSAALKRVERAVAKVSEEYREQAPRWDKDEAEHDRLQFVRGLSEENA